MATMYPLPDLAAVKTMLGLLFDGLEVKAGKKFEFKAPNAFWVGLYVCDDGKAVAACVSDANLSAMASGALSMLPPAMVKDVAKTAKLTDVMEGNLREIMNICTRLVMHDTSAHLKLDSVYPSANLPPSAQELLGSIGGRIDFELTVPKYGAGTLSVISR